MHPFVVRFYIGGMKSGPIFRPKGKEKGFRARIARLLVNLARRVQPDSEEVKAFYMQLIHDFVVYGRSVVRVNPMDTKYIDEETLIVWGNGKEVTYKRCEELGG